MAYAIVSHTSAGPGQNGGTTSAIDTTGASLLVVSINDYSQVPAAADLSDSKGNTWIALTGQSPSLSNERIFYAVNPTVGSGHTFTYSKLNTFPSICVASFSGAKTASPFDVENGSTTLSATSLACGSVTPSENNELVVASIGWEADTGTRSIDSGFTISDEQPYSSGVTMGGALAYKIQTTAAAVNPSWSWSSSGVAAACIAAFKAAAAASCSAVFNRSRVLDGMTFGGGSIFA